MKRSTAATIQKYLEEGIERLELEDLDDRDLEKVLEKIEKAKERAEKRINSGEE